MNIINKFVVFSLTTLLTLASCSSDDNNDFKETENITVTTIDKNLFLNINWLEKKKSYINEDFIYIKNIASSCATDKITFLEDELEMLNFYTIKNQCESIQLTLPYSINRNFIELKENNQVIGALYIVMTLNNDKLVLLQEVDPTDENTPRGAKYIKKEYFKYNKPNN